MPGVRYGPDISDDAAQLMNTIVDLQDKVEGRKAKKLSARDADTLRRASKLAKQLFGLSDADIKARRFKDMGVLAQYSPDGRILSGRKKLKNGKYQYKGAKRNKMAKNWRDGKLMKKKAGKEHMDRAYDASTPGNYRTYTPSNPAQADNPAGWGGATYLGRTAPKRFREARARTMKRAGRANFNAGNKKTGFRGPLRDESDLDRLATSSPRLMAKRPRLGSSRSGSLRKSGGSRGAKGSKPSAAQIRRKRQIQNATKGLTKKASRKSVRVKKATRPARKRR